MLEAARNREIAKMGVNGSAIIGAANTFLQAKLGPELFKAIEPLLATSKMYEAIGVWQREALNGGSSNFSASRSTSERRESISESEWNQMTYHQKRNTALACPAAAGGRNQIGGLGSRLPRN
jgi:hypothetical protein